MGSRKPWIFQSLCLNVRWLISDTIIIFSTFSVSFSDTTAPPFASSYSTSRWMLEMATMVCRVVGLMGVSAHTFWSTMRGYDRGMVYRSCFFLLRWLRCFFLCFLALVLFCACV